MVRLIIGAVLSLIGLLWLGQGVGAIGGSSMTGEPFWAVMGAIALLIGISLIRGARRRRV